MVMFKRSLVSLKIIILLFIFGCGATRPVEKIAKHKISDREYQEGLDYSVWLYSQPINILDEELFSMALSDKLSVAKPVNRNEKKAQSNRALNDQYAVQIASFKSENNAKSYLQDVSGRYSGFQFSLKYSANLWKIIVGNFDNRKKAETVRDNLIKTGFPDAWILRF